MLEMSSTTVIARRPGGTECYRVSDHAWARMSARRLSPADVETVLQFGRRVWARGARIFVIGRREVEQYRAAGLDLARYEGLHVVCSRYGAVMTVYRNRDLSGLRRGRRWLDGDASVAGSVQ